jgi:hypothetical protein
VTTGWPPGLLQDDERKLSRWLASRPDALYKLRKNMTEITRFEMDMDGSMEPSEHGEWVRYEDAQRELDSQYKLGMEAERSRQHDEIERLTNLCYEYLGELTALRAVKQTQDMMRDGLTIGSAWVRDGKRLEPTSVYKGMEEDT